MDIGFNKFHIWTISTKLMLGEYLSFEIKYRKGRKETYKKIYFRLVNLNWES